MSSAESGREQFEDRIEGPLPSSEEHKFIRRLYDKLWENIIHKENRLWTFLTVYGAGIGILLGTGATESIRLPAGCLILILTYWAMELITDADWWSVRNRLLISRIEKRFGDATNGIIPKIYQSPGYHSESIHKASLFALALIGVFIFIHALGYDDGTCFRDRSLIRLAEVTVLYNFAILCLVLCLHRRERRIIEYYETRAELQTEANEPREVASIREDKERKGLLLRLTITILYIIATSAVSLIYWSNSLGWAFWLFVLSQILVVVLWLFQRDQYSWNEKIYGVMIKTDWGDRLTAMGGAILGCFIVSIVTVVLGAFTSDLPWSTSSSPAVADTSRIRDQLDAIRSELDAIEQAERKRLKDVETSILDLRRTLDDSEKISTQRLELHRSDLNEVRKAIKEQQTRVDELTGQLERLRMPAKSKN